jgi:hypothetical protein
LEHAFGKGGITGNRRTKYIHPTKATDKKFDAMGQALKSITT